MISPPLKGLTSLEKRIKQEESDAKVAENLFNIYREITKTQRRYLMKKCDCHHHVC